jgi:pimeloyl-ACP methyl ester carboxylesterase
MQNPELPKIEKREMPEIRNKFGERIDTLVEGKEDADTTIIFAHGLGTGKDEGENLFRDIANAMGSQFRTVRFDFTGYGQSEGRQKDVSIEKHTHDLAAVLDFVRQKYQGKVDIIGHSMGTFVVSLLAPEGIDKTIFTGLPSEDRQESIDKLQKKIRDKGGVVDENGISKYPRTSGGVQDIGPDFWRVQRELNPAEKFEAYSHKTKLVAFKPLQDEVVVNGKFDGYKKIDSLEYFEVNGTHNFSKPEDRQELIKKIEAVLLRN